MHSRAQGGGKNAKNKVKTIEIKGAGISFESRSGSCPHCPLLRAFLLELKVDRLIENMLKNVLPVTWN